MSSLACDQCGSWMVAMEPLEPDSEWECGGCGARLASSQVERIVTSFSDQIQRLYEKDR